MRYPWLRSCCTRCCPIPLSISKSAMHLGRAIRISLVGAYPGEILLDSLYLRYIIIGSRLSITENARVDEQLVVEIVLLGGLPFFGRHVAVGGEHFVVIEPAADPLADQI